MSTNWHNEQTRKLHARQVVNRENKSLETVLQERSSGSIAVIAALDAEKHVEAYVGTKGGQTQLTREGHLSFDGGATLCVEPNGKTGCDPGDEEHPDTFIPYRSEHRFHFASNEFETVVLLFGKCQPHWRYAPFLDATRVCAEGGTILVAPGLRPKDSQYHDASWWIPSSDDAVLDNITLLRWRSCQTPIVVSEFTTTTTQIRRPEATPTTAHHTKI